jgi:hypothetical protein
MFFSPHALAQMCDPSLTTAIRAIEKLVYLPSGGGANPPSQRDDANTRWMYGELGLIREACSRGKDVEAVWRLEQVQLKVTNTGKHAPERPFSRVAEHVGEKRMLTAGSSGAARKTNSGAGISSAPQHPPLDAP